MASVPGPAARRAGTEVTTNWVRAASTSLAKALVAAAVVGTGRPEGMAAAAELAMVRAAESMALLRLAAAWRASMGFMPAWTSTLASTLTEVPEPEPVESARAAVP